MKLNFKAILFAAMTVLMAASCEEGILDRTPVFEDITAEKVELTDVLFSDGERVRPYNYFTVKLGTAGASETSGVVLVAKFVSNEQALHAATFAPVAPGSERRNTYVTGETKLIVNGVSCSVVNGDIKVDLADGTYTLSGVVAVEVPVAEGDPQTAYYDLSWAGAALDFGELPVMTKLTHKLLAKSNLSSGVNTVSVIFTTDKDITVADNYNSWPVVKKDWTGKGNALAIDFYSEKGYLDAGTYVPSADPANPKPGEYVIGGNHEGSFWGTPYTNENGGTCWWTIGETSTAQKITAGDIVVVQNEKSFTIDIDNGELLAQFVGEISELAYIAPKAETVTLETIGMVNTGNLATQKSITVKLGTKGVACAVDGWTEVWSGTGKYFAIDIYAVANEKGEIYIPAGKYTPTTSDKMGENKFVAGYPDPYGIGMIWGTSLNTIEDGKTTSTVAIDAGEITVAEKDGMYSLTGKFGELTILYEGPLTGLVTPPSEDVEEPEQPGEDEGEGNSCGCDCDGCADCTGPGTGSGDEGEGEEGDVVTLSQFWSLTDYHTQYQNNLLGMEVATAGVTKGEFDWNTFTQKYEGTGNYLKFELYTADGTVAPGTYTVSAENSPAAGEFGKGYEGQYGASGSVWYTIVDGVVSYEFITDGTATVEVDGDTYTITLESSVVNATYTGPLSAPAAN